MPGYRRGFEVEYKLNTETRFSAGKTYFVCAMGDLFAPWISEKTIREVLKYANQFPNSRFFFETKNPFRYIDFLEHVPKTAILSATIETNKTEYKLSRAPSVAERMLSFRLLDWPTKHISVEPIADFDEEIFPRQLIALEPWMVAVGYDSLGNGLPEPTLEKTEQLIADLEAAGIRVERKLMREKIAERQEGWT